MNKFVLLSTAILLTACATPPSNPIASDPVVTKRTANTYDISVTGLPEKRSIDVERGFHEVADQACLKQSGWGGWKMREDTQLNPRLNHKGIYVASGTIQCSQ